MPLEDAAGRRQSEAFLKNIRETGKISQAYIFAGPDGSGKKSAAINFAKALNCADAGKVPCGICLSCRKIDSGNFPSLFLIRSSGASRSIRSIKIEDVRGIKKELSLKPYEGLFRVFIIENADVMTQESQNALLKMLEEPPSKTVFILITSYIHRLLVTIRSRAQTLVFKPDAASGIQEKRKNEVIENIKNWNIAGLRADRASNSGRARLKEDLQIILSWFRDLYVAEAGYRGDIFFNNDRRNEILKAPKLPPEKLEALMNRLVTLNSYVEANVNQKLIRDALLDELAGMKAGK